MPRTVTIQYDDYNSDFAEAYIMGGYTGTVTQTFGRDSFRHGYKLIEVYYL